MSVRKKTTKKATPKPAAKPVKGDTAALEWLLHEMKWRHVAEDLVERAEAMR